MTYEKEVEFKLESLWRDVESLLNEADDRARHCRGLLAAHSLPLMTTDLPTKAWMRISEAIVAIAKLKEVVDGVKRGELWKTKKPKKKGKVKR